jgi:hypothetical protein
MNNWNQLLAVLDKIFANGFELNSRITQTKQGFDNEKNEHVVRIEYRYRMTNESLEDHPFQRLSDYATPIRRIHSIRATNSDNSSEIVQLALEQIRAMKARRRGNGSV